MRLWSIHPNYLDSKGLVALWRETLLAQKVLMGQTKGYKNHPQLQRFKQAEKPLNAIAFYLSVIAQVADLRGYHFDKSKIVETPQHSLLTVTNGQLLFEKQHLIDKLKTRDPNWLETLNLQNNWDAHSLFQVISGEIENWEKGHLIYPA
ncbi:MAG: hypothetical protein RIT27_131 [Pseudomonadota bacterium]|jgi:hypothetical protein